MKKTENTESSIWTKTNVSNLYRHRNDRYYARIFVAGKENWKSHKTTLKTVAEERLPEHLGNARKQRTTGIKIAEGKLAFADAVELYRQNFWQDGEIKENTKNFRESGIKLVLKTWPEINVLNVRKITVPMVRDWALRMRSEMFPKEPKKRAETQPARHLLPLIAHWMALYGLSFSLAPSISCLSTSLISARIMPLTFLANFPSSFFLYSSASSRLLKTLAIRLPCGSFPRSTR